MFILLIFHLSALLLGFWISNKILHVKGSCVFIGLSVITLGLLVSLPLTYLIAIALRNTNDPLSLGAGVFSLIGIVLFWFQRHEMHVTDLVRLCKKQKGIWIDILAIFFSLGISTYIMTKTFGENASGSMYVARNGVFDFGHGLSIVRSMSWGQNIPYASPFVAGTEQLYHFMFHFWVAIWEHLGVSIAWAINIPSIVGFTLFLLSVYCIGTEFFGKKSLGFLAPIFCVFQSTLMFISYFQKFGFGLQTILRNPNYFFAGPFDGSIISLFTTLNVFVNQRQLGIGLAMFFVIYLLFLNEINQKRIPMVNILVFGFFVGLLTLWHIVLAIGLLLSLGCVLFLQKKWKQGIIIFISSLLVSSIFVFPWLPYVVRAVMAIVNGARGSAGITVIGKNIPVWATEFIILNFGFALPVFVIGLFHSKKLISVFLPLFILTIGFFVISLPAGIVDQKYFNILLVLVRLFTAAGLVAIWNWKLLGKFVVIILFPLLILSGIIDFMVIKNDFQYPVADRKASPLIGWIIDNTSKDAVFVSYQDIFDPVTLSGRKNYFGFFKQPDVFLAPADRMRPQRVKELYEATESSTVRNVMIYAPSVSYLVIPLWQKPDFDYHVDIPFFRKTFPVAYEDYTHLVITLK